MDVLTWQRSIRAAVGVSSCSVPLIAAGQIHYRDDSKRPVEPGFSLVLVEHCLRRGLLGFSHTIRGINRLQIPRDFSMYMYSY